MTDIEPPRTALKLTRSMDHDVHRIQRERERREQIENENESPEAVAVRRWLLLSVALILAGLLALSSSSLARPSSRRW
jgi:hypothetical protein